MKSVFRLLAFVSIAVSAATVNAGLITNGSFEKPTLAPGTYLNFLGGSTAITGWTVVGVDSQLTTTVGQGGVVFQPQEGNQWIDLAGVNSNSSLSGVAQDVATIIGTTYQLDFYVGSATDNIYHFASTVDLSINGAPRTSFTNPTAPTDHLDWKRFTVSFTATSASTNIIFQNGSTPTNYLSALDNVELSVAAVPEPSSMLIAIGAFAVGIFRRRRSAIVNTRQ